MNRLIRLAQRLPGFSQCRNATLVPQHRCASVPDSNRIPAPPILGGISYLQRLRAPTYLSPTTISGVKR